MKEYILNDLIIFLEDKISYFEMRADYETNDVWKERFIRKINECEEAITYLQETWQEEII